MNNDLTLKQLMAKNKSLYIRSYDQYSIKDPKLKETFLEAFKMADRTIQKFEYLPEYDQVLEWLRDNKGKGLMLAGSYGRGKSILISFVIPLLFLKYHNKVIRTISSKNLDPKDFGWMISIDDVGTEVLKNNYGTKEMAVIDAINHCEDRMKMLIISTNMDKTELTSRYGVRSIDRINRLCQVIPFSGKSFRK